MTKFLYKIKDASGQFKEGSVEGKNKYDIAKDLSANGATVILIEEEGKGFTSINKINAWLSRIKLQEKITFAHNLAAMLDAGLPLARAIGVLEKQSKNPKYKAVLVDLVAEINKGSSLSDGMGKHPKEFSGLFIAMVLAGEESGSLSESLRVVADQLEKSYTLRKKIKGALMYPAVVVIAMIVIAILMFIYVVPTLTEVFEGIAGEGQLPASTRAIIAISEFLVNQTVLFFGSLITFIGLVVYGGRTKKGKRVFEFILLHLPVISKLTMETNSARTARTMSSLLSSGVDMVETINITKSVVQNSRYKEVLAEASDRVQKGVPLSAVFSEHENLYPVLVGAMVEVGEETGQLSEMLLRLATFYEDEVDRATKDLSTIIEPILMLVIGSGVGFFAISMISPMYSLTSSI